LESELLWREDVGKWEAKRTSVRKIRKEQEEQCLKLVYDGKEKIFLEWGTATQFLFPHLFNQFGRETPESGRELTEKYNINRR
jgi:hypothetical protein